MIDPALIQHVTCTLTNHGMGEQPDCANYAHKSLGLLSDPAHITSELIFDALENAVIIVAGLLIGRRALRRQHAELDAEHGYIHKS